MAVHAGVAFTAMYKKNGDALLDLNISALHFLGNLTAILELRSSLLEYAECKKKEENIGITHEENKCAVKSVGTLNCFLLCLFTTYVDALAIARAFVSKTEGDAYLLPVEYRILTVFLFSISILSFFWCLWTFLTFREQPESRTETDARLADLAGTPVDTKTNFGAKERRRYRTLHI